VAIPKRSEQNPRRLEYPTIEVDSDNATHHRGVLFCNPDTATVACQVYQDLAVLVNNHKTKFRLYSEPHVISITNNVEEQLQAYRLCRDDVFAVVLPMPPAGAKTDPACRHLMQALVRYNLLSHWCNFDLVKNPIQASASVLSGVASTILNKAGVRLLRSRIPD
jgi:hypothetical protein